MSNKRTGTYGEYYGSYYSESEALTTSQMKVNATYIYKYLTNKGWTKNAVAGLLGNMQAESSINPGRWQSEAVGSTSLGYGLVQWTPATKYLEWCNSKGYSDPSEMDNNLSRIIYELENGIQWIETSEYNLSFEEFSKSTKSVSYLASAFLKCYERAGVEVEATRQANATSWLEYLNGVDVGGSGSGDSGGSSGGSVTFKKRKQKFKFYLFKRRYRINA